MRPLVPALLLSLCALPTHAACNVREAGLEEALAAKPELRQPANEQLVRDLRTLRDAAIVLETSGFGAECERLVTIVATLAADPKRTIERGDTDEDKAEALLEASKPKAAPAE
jgi:dephospho-CoA kinase